MLFMWTTNGFLVDSLNIVSSWEFRKYCLLTWCKKMGPIAFGPVQFMSEFVIFAIRDGKWFREFPMGRIKSWFTSPYIRKHSRKPIEFYKMIRPVTPKPRIDIFSRRNIKGFDSWGDESSMRMEHPVKVRWP